MALVIEKLYPGKTISDAHDIAEQEWHGRKVNGNKCVIFAGEGSEPTHYVNTTEQVDDKGNVTGLLVQLHSVEPSA